MLVRLTLCVHILSLENKFQLLFDHKMLMFNLRQSRTIAWGRRPLKLQVCPQLAGEDAVTT